jgi:hypothetical protein
MELFPAANEDQWTLIREYIDDCDYYIVIIAGRYGSLGPDGKSYTELEYRYAVESGKPIIAFLRKNPGDLAADQSEKGEAGQRGLAEFRKLAEQRMCKYWTSAADLGSQVSRSLVKLIKSHPAEGWIRANQVSDAATRELLRLRSAVDELQRELEGARLNAPGDTDTLARGDDPLELRLVVTFNDDLDWTSGYPKETYEIATTWNEVFHVVSPLLIGDCSERTMRDSLSKYLQEMAHDSISKVLTQHRRVFSANIDEADFQTIKVQLKSLGLIVKSSKARSVSDSRNYWTLTHVGDNEMTKLRAVRRTPEALIKNSDESPG